MTPRTTHTRTRPHARPQHFYNIYTTHNIYTTSTQHTTHNTQHTTNRSTVPRGVLVVFVFDELQNDFLLWLDLKHLQDQAHERRRPSGSTMCAADVIQFHGAVHQRLCCQTEAMLLPVTVVINTLPQQRLDQVLCEQHTSTSPLHTHACSTRRHTHTHKHHTKHSITPPTRLHHTPVDLYHARDVRRGR